MARYSAVLFDWDGTLVDSLSTKIQNAAQLFATRLGADGEHVAQSYRRHSGLPRRVLFGRIVLECTGRELSDGEFDTLSTEFTRLNLDALRDRDPVRQSARGVLGALGGAGVMRVVSSAAATDEVRGLVEAFGLSPLFDEVLGSEPGCAKGREHVARVCGRFGMTPNTVLMVGDEPTDVALALAAGVDVMALVGTHTRDSLQSSGATAVIDDLTEVLAYVI